MALLGLALLLAGNWILPLIDRDEPRFAEASREMLQRRDFIVPHFNGDYRFDKPPLIYWCQAASYCALGENAFAARLPSAVFATGTALLLLFWGARLGQARVGLYAALMFVTCLQILAYGRMAIADMPMIFFFAAAVWAGWEMARERGGGMTRWWWMFYASLGLGFLAKGPEAWLPLAGLWVVCWFRPWSFRVNGAGMIIGLLLSAAIVMAWAAPALAATQGEFFRVGIGRHVIHRSLGAMEGHGASGWIGYLALLPLYFVTFFASFFPWSIWAPAALKKGATDDLPFYLLTQAAIVFALFTLAATKLPHYTLPAFPCLALWLAFHLDEQQIRRAVAVQVALLMVALCGFWFLNRHLLAVSIWRKAGPSVRPATRVASVDFHEPSLVWEFRRVSTNYVDFIDLAGAQFFWRQPGPRCLIIPTKNFDMGQFIPAANASIERVTGTDTASFRRWDVIVLTRK